MSKLPSLLKRVVKATVEGFSDDELMTRAAALAFYAALSVAPVLLLMVWILSLLHPGLEAQLTEALRTTVGEKAAGSLQAVIASAHAHPRLGHVAGIVGLGVTLFSASAVFAQLQGTLDRVWRVRPKPGAAVGAWLRARARAFALLGGVAFLLIVSLVVSAVIQALFSGEGTVWTVVKYAVSVFVFAGAFMLMFRVLPDAVIEWGDAFLGAVLTMELFLVGEFGIGLYVAHSDIGGAYGPAGAFVVLLTWTYYSSIIILVGAELTRSLAEARGKPIRPSAHAVQIEPAPAEIGKPGEPGPARSPRRVSRASPASASMALVAIGVAAGLLVRRRR